MRAGSCLRRPEAGQSAPRSNIPDRIDSYTKRERERESCFSSGFALLEPRGMTLLNQRPTLGLSKALQASSLSSNNCSMWFVLAQKAQLVNGLRSLGTGLLAAQPSQFWHRRDHFRLSKQMHVLLRTINQSNTRSKRTAQDVLPEDDISCAEWKKGCRVLPSSSEWGSRSHGTKGKYL